MSKQMDDPEVMISALRALRNTAQIVGHLPASTQKQMTQLTIDILKRHANNPDVLSEACRVLTNLAALENELQVHTVSAGAVQVILDAMKDHTVFEPGIMALCNIGWQNRFCQDAIVELGGIEVIVNTLNQPDVSETSQRWGRVLLEKIENKGIQRGLLVHENGQGHPSVYDSTEIGDRGGAVGLLRSRQTLSEGSEGKKVSLLETMQQHDHHSGPCGPATSSPVMEAASGAINVSIGASVSGIFRSSQREY